MLHLLSQRPGRTGSGVTLDALVRHAEAAGWDQNVVVGVPAEDPTPPVGGLGAGRLHPLRFNTRELDFEVPGMSDAMPYPSTRFSAMTQRQLSAYRGAWRRHLETILEQVQPDLIHSHHVWMLSALVKDVAPVTPVVTHCHATGLRQMTLCSDLAEEVRRGCRRNDRFVVLHRGHAAALGEQLRIAPEAIRVVGAGYREDLFHSGAGEGEGGAERKRRLLYVGKLTAVKGLPELLDAFTRLRRRAAGGESLGESLGEPLEDPAVELHVAGSGAGAEAEALRRRMAALASELPGSVVQHGHLEQPQLAALMRRSAVCVLPSYYEGLPLVLVEAAACGCRLVATALPGVVEQLEPHLRDVLHLVAPPRMVAIDTPAAEEVPAFVDRLEAALEQALRSAAGPLRPEALEPFTWSAVFRRIEAVWSELLGR